MIYVEAAAALSAAKVRGDTRAVGVALRALRRAMHQQMRREIEQRKGRPLWRMLWGRR